MRKPAFIIVLLAAIWACQPNEDQATSAGEQELSQRIDAMEAEMKKKDELDTSLATDMVQAYRQYARKNPQDSMAAVYLYRAGNVYKAWPGKGKEAIENYRKVVKEYKYSPQAPEAAFASAFVYEQYGNRSHAAGAYRYVMNNYPKHPLARDAENLLDMLQDTKTTDLERVQQWRKDAENNKKAE